MLHLGNKKDTVAKAALLRYIFKARDLDWMGRWDRESSIPSLERSFLAGRVHIPFTSDPVTG